MVLQRLRSARGEPPCAAHQLRAAAREGGDVAREQEQAWQPLRRVPHEAGGARPIPTQRAARPCRGVRAAGAHAPQGRPRAALRGGAEQASRRQGALVTEAPRTQHAARPCTNQQESRCPATILPTTRRATRRRAAHPPTAGRQGTQQDRAKLAPSPFAALAPRPPAPLRRAQEPARRPHAPSPCSHARRPSWLTRGPRATPQLCRSLRRSSSTDYFISDASIHHRAACKARVAMVWPFGRRKQEEEVRVARRAACPASRGRLPAAAPRRGCWLTPRRVRSLCCSRRARRCRRRCPSRRRRSPPGEEVRDQANTPKRPRARCEGSSRRPGWAWG